MKRFTRLAAIAVGTLALVGAMAPPASAATTITTTFTGRATTDGGLGYPTTLPTPNLPTTDCLDPLPDGNPVPNCHPHYPHHVRGVTVTHTECVDTTTNVAKPNKAPAHTGPCTFSASGHVSGHCGASGGQVQGTYTDSLGQVYNISVHFTGVGGNLTITGHVEKQSDPSQRGKITGEVTAVPEIETPVLTTPARSCTNKTQTEFILAGETTITTT